jgi:hypothetical protein
MVRLLGKTAFVLVWSVLSILGATYKGKNIDGKKYKAVAGTEYGPTSADVKFEGRKAYLYFETWTHTVYLQSIDIKDPKNISATDGHHQWTISIVEGQLD